MNPGGDTVTFVSVALGTPDRLGVRTEVDTPTVVKGCSFQPLAVKDNLNNSSQYADSTHKCISPPTSAVLACKAEDKLQFAGDEFRVQGVKVYRDGLGIIDHVDVICKWEQG